MRSRELSNVLLAIVCLLVVWSAEGLEITFPADGATVTSEAVMVEYSTSGSYCEAVVNGKPMILPSCVPFTMVAQRGANTLTIWDGTEVRASTFTYQSNQAPPATRPSQNTRGVTLRGRTGYSSPTVLLTAPGGPAQEVNDLGGRSGRHRVDIRPSGGNVRRVVLEDVLLPQQIDLGLEDLPSTVMESDTPVLQAFAIDPTRITFTNGTLTALAAGNRVWKCALWNFTTSACEGDWEFALFVEPGEEYNLTFTAADPAYAETFDTDPGVDVSIAALDNTTLVIAFIDSETGNHASFEIWSTNGVRLVDEVDIDATGDTGSMIEVTPLNSTHFAIGVIDSPENDADFFIYDRTGSQLVGQTQVDPNMGASGDVGICGMGDRFGYVWADANDGDANFEIWSNTGTVIAAENQVDIGITPSANTQNLVSCAAMNTTHFGYAFYDDADNDATLAVVNSAGTIQVAATDIDGNVGETGQVAAAGLRNGWIAMAFYDSTDDDITITIRSAAGAALNTILAATDIDTNAGTVSRVSVAEIEDNGASDFVVAWQDTADSTIKAAIYNNSGSQVTAPFNITLTTNSSFSLMDVAGYNSQLGTGLCNGTFAIAYSNTTGGAVFETYWINGSRWDGVCGAPDIADPVVTLIYPPNATTNTTSNTIDFYFNVTDSSAIANCTLNIDGSPDNTLSNPTKDATLNITTQLGNGEYLWSITCIDINGNTSTTEQRDIAVDVPLLISGADTKLVALDNTTLVIAFIDGSANDASFEIWHTNGTRLVNIVDVDSTVDGDSRIDVDPINTTHFIVGVLDGPEDDFDFYIYDREGNQVLGQTQIDPSAGANTDVAICQLGDRFAAPWADSADGDANFEMWDNTGTVIATENQVDTSISPGATLQNLVACGPLNSTHWGYAFYDDTDNDATLAIVNGAGTIQVAATDIDGNVGETGQVAAAGLRGDRVAMAFYDSTDDDITITIRSAAGAALNTILAATDIDTNAGTDSRLSVAEIENNGTSDFVVAWHDASDTTIKAAVYDDAGSQVTAPFTITTVPSTGNLLLDVVGYYSTLGFGLCNGTFAITYTNSSGNTLFQTYFLNGTASDGECGVAPNITAVALPSSVVLNAGTTKTVQCNLTVVEPDGIDTLGGVNATFSYWNTSYTESDSPDTHYTNTSCIPTGNTPTQQNYTCSFAVWYFAANGTWTCTGAARDIHGHSVIGAGNTTIDPLYALNVTSTLLDFGDLQSGQTSPNLTENITNVGNMVINVSVLGYGAQLGDGHAFVCGAGNLSVDVVRFAPNITATYAIKQALGSTYSPLRLLVPRQTTVGSVAQNTSYWQVRVPQNTSFISECNGTIVFQADGG